MSNHKSPRALCDVDEAAEDEWVRVMFERESRWEECVLVHAAMGEAMAISGHDGYGTLTSMLHNEATRRGEAHA